MEKSEVDALIAAAIAKSEESIAGRLEEQREEIAKDFAVIIENFAKAFSSTLMKFPTLRRESKDFR